MGNQHYASMIMANKNKEYVFPGGGLGGGHRGTGDYSYGGVFFHEQGHAFNIPHVGETHKQGKYPHVGGSLKGSAWGFDFDHNVFMSPVVPSSANSIKNCLTQTFDAGDPRQTDANGACIKQDPMQSGAGDQASIHTWAMFADFNVAKIQSYFEGGVKPYYGTGRMYPDTSFSSGYARWNREQKRYVEVEKKTVENGLYGLDGGIPTHVNTEVDTIIVTLSFPESFPTESGLAAAPTSGITQIYPPLRFTGNAVRQIRADNADDLTSITPNTGALPWFCRGSGCDYSVKVTYTDASTKAFVLNGGFRKWFWTVTEDDYNDDAKDPKKGASYKVWGIGVPTDGKTLQKVELLHTPMVWKGMPANPKVLATYTP